MAPNAAVVVDSRFQGIPEVALGGYVGGLLAADLAGAEATFRRPVPLGRPLRVEGGEGSARALVDGPVVLAKVHGIPLVIPVPPAVGLEEADAARREYPGLRRHLFPRCFTCGPSREEGDGLRIFPGPVGGREVVASSWTPDRALATEDGEVRREYVWSALDCPSIWALVPREPVDSRSRFVSARMAVRQHAPVLPRQPHVVVGWEIGREERSRTGGAAILSASGRVCAVARHTLLPADWGVPLTLAAWT
jgi:hypothetical protein